MRRKCRRKIIYVDRTVHNEIDYNKLAEAIVKANHDSEKLDLPKGKVKFWKTIGLIILNKKKSNGTVTSNFLGGIIADVFNVLSFLGVCLSLLCFVALGKTIYNMNWSTEFLATNIAAIFVIIALIFVILVFSLIFRASANEIATEKDRNYIISVFSSVVSFAALVVALVALFKGVG